MIFTHMAIIPPFNTREHFVKSLICGKHGINVVPVLPMLHPITPVRQRDTPNRAVSMLTPCGHSREQTKANHMWTQFELVISHPSKIVLSQFITSFKYWFV